jgi:peptide/nickel transport system substrate-binding protein
LLYQKENQNILEEKMKKRGFVLLALLTVFVMVLSACQPAAEAPAAEAPAAEAPAEEAPAEEAPAEEAPAEEAPAADEKAGGTIYLGTSAVIQFDTPFINDDASFHVASLVHVFLFRNYRDNEGNETSVPELAESWEIQEDGKVIIFHLKQGWTFQDGNEIFAEGEGREITAEDVAYSLDRLATVEGSMAASDYLSSFESAEAIDTYTVKLTLKQPDAILFASGRGISSAAILPREAVEQLGESWGLNPIGGGAFEFVEYVADDHVTLRKNEDYAITPNLDEVVFRITPDQNTQIISLEAGDIDWMSLPAEEFERFDGNDDYKLYAGNCPYSFHIQFDLKNPLFQDIKVREALSRAVDGHAIMQNEFGGMFIEGFGIAGPGVPGFDSSLTELYSYDPTKTETLMTEAGWAKNANGIWEKDGQPFSVDFEVWNMSPAPVIATAAATMLNGAGFEVNLIEVEFGTWVEDATGVDTQKPLMMWSGFCGEGGLNSYYGVGGLGRGWGYDDQEVFDLLDSADTVVDAEERLNTLQTATHKIYEIYPDIPFGFAVQYEITTARVNDWANTMWWLKFVSTQNNVWLSQ